ncbi:MAG: 16S rRNA (cytosine(1402)-N(4))-methyltransferase RsmH [Alphaproteobacteria bacterium]
MTAHHPVMLAEVLAALAPRDGAVYLDGTFGAGGYSRAILDAATCTVWAIDRDPEAVARGAAMSAAYGERFHILHGRFSDMARLLAAEGVTAVDGIALDLGVSSPQLDDAARGFSFRFDSPLDMRMESKGETAAEVIARASESEIADILYRFGEERHARRIARAVVAARGRAPIERTMQLRDIVRAAVPKSSAETIDAATRTFQALRIYVNDELAELDHGLAAAESLLAPGGVLVVVSFHSLEDRRVKTFLRSRSGGAPRASRHLPAEVGRAAAPTFELVTRRAVRPASAEVEQNPRARSARMRAGRRTTAPASSPDHDSWSRAA